MAAPYIFIIMYIVQLYKEDWAILCMFGCQAVALPSAEGTVCHLHKMAETEEEAVGLPVVRDLLTGEFT